MGSIISGEKKKKTAKIGLHVLTFIALAIIILLLFLMKQLTTLSTWNVV
jgi:hypothetical protein